MRLRLALAISALSLLFTACSSGSSAPPSPPVSPPPPPVNTVPVASDVAGMTNVDEVLDAAMNAQDADGDALTYSITVQPTLGGVQILDAATGAFRFTPNAAVFGTDTFSYQVNDGSADSMEAVVTIVINRKPVAQDLSMRVATSLAAAGSLAGSDADGDTVTYVIATQPANGTIQNFDAATGAFTYNAMANFEGADSFTYQTNDGFADSQAATFSLSVNEWLGTVSFGTANDEDAIYGLAIDDQMNLFVAYETSGAVPGETSAGGTDVALAMVDKAGTVLWQTQWGTTDNDSAYLLIRAADGSLYLGSNSGLNNAPTSQHVVKFDADGNLLWELQLPEPSTRTQLYRMALAPNGNLYVNAFDFPRSQLMKITPGGTLVWTKILGTSDDDAIDPLLIGLYDSYTVQVRDFVVDANEIIYMALNLEYTESGNPPTPYTSMLASFNSDGTILSRLQPFATTAWPLGDEPARLLDMQRTGAGNLRVAGYTHGGNLAVAETDTAGSEIWSTTRSVVDEIRTGFSGWIDANGDTLVSGRADSRITPGVNQDVFLAKYSDAGVFLWESILSGIGPGGTTDVIDDGGQPVTDADGSVFMLVASDGGAIGSGTNQGGWDVFLVKLDGSTGAMIHP